MKTATLKISNYEITENLTIEEITGVIRKGSQSVNYDSLLKVTHQGTTKKLKIEIKRDSYANQSYARIAIWSTTTESWNHVAGIACTESVLYYQINPYQSDPGLESAERKMKITRGNLINMAAEVIF